MGRKDKKSVEGGEWGHKAIGEAMLRLRQREITYLIELRGLISAIEGEIQGKARASG